MYGHDPVQVGLRGMPIGFGILVGAFIVLWLLSIYRGGNRPLMIGSSIVMTAGCGALAAARLDNLPAVYAILVIAGLGIGGIVVPASIMTTIVCPDDLIATVTALTLSIRVVSKLLLRVPANTETNSPKDRRRNRLHSLLQRLLLQARSRPNQEPRRRSHRRRNLQHHDHQAHWRTHRPISYRGDQRSPRHRR